VHHSVLAGVRYYKVVNTLSAHASKKRTRFDSMEPEAGKSHAVEAGENNGGAGATAVGQGTAGLVEDISAAGGQVRYSLRERKRRRITQLEAFQNEIEEMLEY